MPVNRVEVAVYVISARASAGGNLDQMLAEYTDLATNEPLTLEEADEVRVRVLRDIEYQRARNFAQVEDPALVADVEDHQDWYEDWLEQNRATRYYWTRLSDFVGEQLQDRYTPEEAGRIVRSTDVASDMILRQLEAPSRGNFKTKGLVIGHVQSGKTANFTAVIAKAVDAGYRLIVVLTGVNNNLRRQTQQRLDRELTGEPDAEDVTHVEVPAMDSRRWVRATDHDFDFILSARSNLGVLADSRQPILAVMKKNKAPLNKFIRWATRSTMEARGSLPLLVIDDEADLASIDTNAPRGAAPTTTNLLIRTVLDLFPRNAYVGYTATPFANVLINMHTDDPQLGRDLYPRNFIVSLPRPVGYFGAERVFASDTSRAYIRFVPQEEIDLLVPRPQAMTETLIRAVNSFVLAGSARIHRDQGAKPVTMLIHTHQRQASHHVMRELVDTYLRSLRSRWQDRYEHPRIAAELQNLWDTDFIPATLLLERAGEIPARVCSFAEIESCIEAFLDQLRIFELNTSSFDELDYTEHPDLKVLAVGANKLSRGLTLEGLTTSFYLRKSTEYDTLLQMGRWFGYRHGYEDLTRVYTSMTLATWFSDLAVVEQLLRDEVSRYEDEGLTPVEFAVRIRAHRNMRVTARNKMGAGQPVQGTFSKQLSQTFLFPLTDPEFLRGNLNAGEAFINATGREGQYERAGDVFLVQGVDHGIIDQFLRTYRFRSEGTGGSGIDAGQMLAYIARLQASEELREWNVGVVTRQTPGPAQNVAVRYGEIPEIIPIIRSRIKITIDPRYNLGVISDPAHLAVDLPGGSTDPFAGRHRPLLLLYRISRFSAPNAQRPGNREPLFQDIPDPVDVLGLVFVFPESRTEPYGFIAQDARGGA